MNSNSSKLLSQAVDAFASLPGIGKKTALRLVLHLLNQENYYTERMSEALVNMRNNIKRCSKCNNISDEEVCAICTNAARSNGVLCIVESIRDVIAIEDTQQFNGRYHVLGGLISPLEGVGPDQLNLQSLKERIEKDDIREIIMALNPTIDGDTTIFYLSRLLRDLPVKISLISRGVSFGGELEYTDELTLGRSILARVPYATPE
ncbi:MAG: recombination protein RecR [Saprospiraceae bacterium]|jgi:recombination protein RecR|nr:recombination protein RecR [Saprospiraceae bacterium]